jgi:hypothetical protein
MKKFYIVNNIKDLTSGQVIPHKVLDYIPMSTMMPIMPMKVKKMQGLVVSPGLSPISPIMSPAYPYATTTVERIPLIPGLPSTTTNYSFPNQQMMYGPPIIKLGPLMQNNTPARIQIKSDTITYTLDVPYTNVRDVWSYIWQHAHDATNNNEPRVIFSFYASPVYNYTVQSTVSKMTQIVQEIQRRFPNVGYMAPNGNRASLLDLLALMRNPGLGYQQPQVYPSYSYW